MSKAIPPVPGLPRPAASESTYDIVLSRALIAALVDIAYVLNEETVKNVSGSTFAEATSATQTGLMLFDFDNNTVERVTVGAADSGGAGFKVLRIPN